MADAQVPVDDGRCFACGPENPIGLHLRFDRTGDQSVAARTTLAPLFQGWRDIAHGGIAIALLDEAMAHAAAAAGYRGVTASMSTRFRAPVPLETELTVSGEVLWRRRTVLGLRAEVRSGEALLLSGEGHFVIKGRLSDVADHRT